MPWPAEGVKNAENGSCTSQPSPGPGLEACLIPLIHAITEQTAAINRLVTSNEALIQAMADSEGVGDEYADQTTSVGLDGIHHPVR